MVGFTRPVIVVPAIVATLWVHLGPAAVDVRAQDVVAAADRGRIDALVKQAADLIEAGSANAAKVLTLLEPVLDEPGADPAAVSEVHYWIATAYYRQTKYSEALQHYRLAIDGERAAHDRQAEARTLRYVGQLYKNEGAYADGLAACDEALAIDREIGNARGMATTAVVRGAIRDLMGDHRGALASYEEALPVFENEVTHDAANLFNEIAITYKNLGNYAEALRFYNRSLEVDVQIKDTRGQVFVLLNLGILYSTLGENERGLGFTQRGLELARQTGERRAERILLLNLGDHFWLAGQRQHAIDAVQQALQAARKEGARSEENVALKDLGDMQAALGQRAEARRSYEEALRIERDIGERRMEASTLVALADLSVAEGNPTDAMRFAERGLALARDTARPELEWTARRTLAAAHAASGRTTEAIGELQASARIINDLRANVTSDSSKVAFVDRRRVVFEDLAGLLARTGRAEEALEAAEAGRARAFADLLAQRQILGKPAARDALDAVRTAQRNLHAVTAGPTSGGVRPAGSRTAGAEAFAASLATLRQDHGELASLLTAESPSAAAIVETAKRLDATIVEYLVAGEQLLIWVVTAQGDVHVAPVNVGRERLESQTKALRAALDPETRTRADRERAAARELHRLLVSPVEAWLPASADVPLVIVPDGPLALVPFAALEDESGRPLALRHTLAFAPAASVYGHTRDKIRRAAEHERRALIVADPSPPAGSGVDALPWAREEGHQVAERLHGTPVRLLVGSDASEAVVKRDAGTYSVLHFATHGLVSPVRPIASSILLAAGDGEDGYLQMNEIFDLDLAAELVVLSGCSTGLGRVSGDGIIGLTRAFLYAGTPTVVVSQWDVSDRATAFLMDRFYDALRRGQSKAAALRTAQLATRQRYPNPALWAAFILVGEPR